MWIPEASGECGVCISPGLPLPYSGPLINNAGIISIAVQTKTRVYNLEFSDLHSTCTFQQPDTIMHVMVGLYELVQQSWLWLFAVTLQNHSSTAQKVLMANSSVGGSNCSGKFVYHMACAAHSASIMRSSVPVQYFSPVNG